MLLVLFLIVGLRPLLVQGQPTPHSNQKVIIAVFAHADDEVTVSPILARYAREGHKVYLVIATDGQNGVTPHAKIPAGDSLAKVRKGEAICAAGQLHINSPIMLGFIDGALSSLQNYQLLNKKLDSIFQLLKADVVLTWGPDGGYGHADHRAVSNVITELYQQGNRQLPKRLLYTGFPTEAFRKLPPMKTFFGQMLSRTFHTTAEIYLPYQVSYTEADLATARAAYACHKSQFQPDAMDEIFALIKLTGNKIFLREPFGTSAGIKREIFD